MNSSYAHMTVALVGQPNTGKSTIFGLLTGIHQEVGNWPGKTVEKKSGRAPEEDGAYTLVDLPGVYALKAQSPEESVTENYLQHGDADLTIIVASAVSPERTLSFALDVLAYNRPSIVVINLNDVAQSNGVHLDVTSIEKALGVPVVLLSAVDKNAAQKLKDAVDKALQKSPKPGCLFSNQELSEEARYEWIESFIGRNSNEALATESPTAKWDRWLLHPFWGLVSMVLILFITLFVGFGVGFPLTVYVAEAFTSLEPAITSLLTGAPVLSAMALGVWKGLGAVSTMLPFLMVFYAVFATLEDVGYMAWVAFVMDRAMSRLGLDGKAFIPLLFAMPCNVTGVVGTRIIESSRQRFLTMLLIPLVPCAAKLMVMASLASWFFTPWVGIWVILGLCCLNLTVLTICSLLFGIIKPAQSTNGLLLELPHFHKPQLCNIGKEVLRNSKNFLRKACTLIIAFSAILWFLSYYPTGQINTSILGRFGMFLEPIGAWIGADWRLITALVSSLITKEALLATLAVLYAVPVEDLGAALQGTISPASAIAFMCAQSLFIPCIVTVGILYSESRSWKLLMIMSSYTLILPFVVASIVYHLAGMIF